LILILKYSATKVLRFLYLYDPVDDFVISSLRKFKDFELKTVDSVDLKSFDKFSDVKGEGEKLRVCRRMMKNISTVCCQRIKEILGDRDHGCEKQAAGWLTALPVWLVLMMASVLRCRSCSE
jgi:HSP90 family molecular chaperone